MTDQSSSLDFFCHDQARYLLSKRDVDDQALNRVVWSRLRREAGGMDRPIEVLEIGSGVGTMLERLVEWGFPRPFHYTSLEMDGNLVTRTVQRLGAWATEREWTWSPRPTGLVISTPEGSMLVDLHAADFYKFSPKPIRTWDVVIAHAVLDLLDLPSAIRRLAELTRPGGLWWLTLLPNGVTRFLPQENPSFDNEVEAAYLASLDRRGGRPAGAPAGRTGGRALELLPRLGAEVLAAGGSDWVVIPPYKPGEEYLLRSMLHFHREALEGFPGLDKAHLREWLVRREEQAEDEELSLVVHQLDILARWPGGVP